MGQYYHRLRWLVDNDSRLRLVYLLSKLNLVSDVEHYRVAMRIIREHDS